MSERIRCAMIANGALVFLVAMALVFRGALIAWSEAKKSEKT